MPEDILQKTFNVIRKGEKRTQELEDLRVNSLTTQSYLYAKEITYQLEIMYGALIRCISDLERSLEKCGAVPEKHESERRAQWIILGMVSENLKERQKVNEFLGYMLY